MCMPQNFAYVAMSIAYYLLAVVIPIIPAAVIYWLFPNATVSAEGPLSGLTVKATGAFAAYIIVFGMTAYFWNKTVGSLDSLVSASWTVKGHLEVHDAADRKLSDPKLLRNVQITFDPDITRSRGGHFDVKVPDINGDIPNLTFSIGEGGTSETIDFSDPGDYKIVTDTSKNLKTIKTPVIIRLLPAEHPYRLQTPLLPLPASKTRPVLQTGNG